MVSATLRIVFPLYAMGLAPESGARSTGTKAFYIASSAHAHPATIRAIPVQYTLLYAACKVRTRPGTNFTGFGKQGMRVMSQLR
jgi:hypothetical protein